jgi:hypothetical protein
LIRLAGSTHLKLTTAGGASIGAAMTSIQAFLLGLMVAWTPSLIAFAVLLWRAPVIAAGGAGRSTPRGGARIPTAGRY